MKFLPEAIQTFEQGQPTLIGGGGYCFSVFELLKVAGDANLDKFIEIAGCDGEEFSSLKRRIGRVLRLLEHPSVEEQPAFFAIEVATGRRRRLGFTSARGAAGPFLRGSIPFCFSLRDHRESLKHASAPECEENIYLLSA